MPLPCSTPAGRAYGEFRPETPYSETKQIEVGFSMKYSFKRFSNWTVDGPEVLRYFQSLHARVDNLVSYRIHPGVIEKYEAKSDVQLLRCRCDVRAFPAQ